MIVAKKGYYCAILNANGFEINERLKRRVDAILSLLEHVGRRFVTVCSPG